jgi:hypothetical protein
LTHLAVKAARAQQGLVQDIWAVGGGQDNDASVALKAVHLSQQLHRGHNRQKSMSDVMPRVPHTILYDSHSCAEESTAHASQRMHQPLACKQDNLVAGHHPAVGSGTDQIGFKSGSHLVDGLLTLIVATTHTSATLAADSINLIDEHDAGGLGLGLQAGVGIAT